MKTYSLHKLKSSGIAPYIWIIFTILPYYFIFQSSATIEIIIGIILTVLFFVTFRFAFLSKKWPVYMWTAILIAISMTMLILFKYVYFAFFIAYYNGNIKNRVTFFIVYIIHLVGTTAGINYNFVIKDELFLTQLPFVIIILISVILLPFNIYNRKKQEQLEAQLEFANQRIADLVKQEERQRIARDLHDTLGQKLSLIGLKSDLARKLVYKDPEKARDELKDVQQTARTALNEVRKMVSQMKGIRLREEIIRVKQILQAAQIEFVIEENIKGSYTSIFIENILSMCLKEAVTNVVKHSKATVCKISIEQKTKEISIKIEDNGIGIAKDIDILKGNGLQGMKERLDFVNGTLEIENSHGTIITVSVPLVIKQEEGGEKHD
ncbi:two-component system, NarL family, sensor histidine kinase DesK [Cytobacillus horneckiae]|uniref:histidine kinase n=1 Tax=Cytobacillus horneckiae TaxID=549687 RepID=A0A2N0ZDZ1_9BACI|nr:sensor histidine kinase [Cytobacillus horneckiae]MBN6886828.1 sensor histidine kinase [Cytobacillus horneckiae]MEC1158016.1 sensor histidine kinase [Cytobacillus horneckiae]MED2937059.1 sensor histidine kinase [Cytobacillus horneckiae]PKG27713.1 sensor histidine kinase [Cytobacillus horneckiae]